MIDSDLEKCYDIEMAAALPVVQARDIVLNTEYVAVLRMLGIYVRHGIHSLFVYTYLKLSCTEFVLVLNDVDREFTMACHSSFDEECRRSAINL